MEFEPQLLEIESSFDDPVIVFRVDRHVEMKDRPLMREHFQSVLDEAGLGDRKFLVVDRGVDVTSV